MKIIPAIDIQDRKCVRLTKGDLNSTVKYFDDPIQAAEHWYSYGIDRIHIVDLDGAKKGQSLILNIIHDIKKKLPKVSLQVGGGFRNKETIEYSNIDSNIIQEFVEYLYNLGIWIQRMTMLSQRPGQKIQEFIG